MKTKLLVALLLCNIGMVFGQAEKASYKSAADRFANYYNKDKYDSIFYMYGEQMKSALPIEKTSAFIVNLKAKAGAIKKMEFTGYNSTSGLYKTTFDNVTFMLGISLDDKSLVNGLFVKPYEAPADNSPTMERNATAMSLPFKGEWTVIWGGDTKELNHHVSSKAQKNAFDIVVTGSNGSSFKTDGKTNEDYYAFGQEILAPCDGEVVLVVDGVKDNKPGTLNPFFLSGNTVIIKTAANEYLFFAHFKKHNIKVTEGQKVKQGEVLGLCGNSGNSSEAHIHFHIQNVEDMNVATGVKCYFSKLMVNGVLKTDYSPIKGEKISNGK